MATKKALLSAKDIAEVPEALSTELREALERIVQEKLRGGRETAGNRSRTLSVKVDPERYKRLLRARMETERSGQEIFIEAIDQWFKKNRF